MQFVANGPDIPDALLQAHEEGRVVFFCGAGVSYPAGLPGFDGLVEAIYRLAGTTRSRSEEEAFKRGQFDATLDLLERRLPGQRLAVRRHLAQALKPNLRRKGATTTHEALLTLAGTRSGALRLVTTNFDQLFEKAAKRAKQTLRAYPAPLLPVPKNSRWDGLVYLHGCLPDRPDEAALNRLVITSGDFGLAYLTERWAARFVSELFRNYIVCFVGYSLNDPVMRYMMDALAADRMLGESTPQAWALGDYEPGHEASKRTEWEAKGVTPILYEVTNGGHDHSALHRTLQEWAATYRDGVTGKERIIVNHAIAKPSASTKQDDFVGRVLWALSDPSGLPARRFADLKPVPPLDWLLDALSDERFQEGDLPRFRVTPRQEAHSAITFSVVRRPSAYWLAQRMTLVTGGIAVTEWDAVMTQLARWLLRHLNDARLIIWIAERGGQIHQRWAWLLQEALTHIASLEREGKVKELADIRAGAPNGIPVPVMRTLWQLLLSGRVKSTGHNVDLYRWKKRFAVEGLTPTLRVELRQLLSARVSVRRPFRWSEEEPIGSDVATRVRQLVDWELVLASDHVRAALSDRSSGDWESALPLLLDEFQLLLRDALDLLRELGDAADRHDRSQWDIPSISPHWQNRAFRDWVVLIELLRDSWVAVRRADAARATRVAVGWFEVPYPTFKRLALFAASHEGTVDPEIWAQWLLADSAWWLWSTETKREVCRLLATQGKYLSAPTSSVLEAVMLLGPPRAMYPADLEQLRWEYVVDRAIWLRLSKWLASRGTLGGDVADRLTALTKAYPDWQLDADERDEFSHWMSGTGDPGFEKEGVYEDAPRQRLALIEWLKTPVSAGHVRREDNWREVCRLHFYRSWRALCDLAHANEWPIDRWREALQSWSEESRTTRSWRYAAPLVRRMPDAVLSELADSVSWWMEAASKSFDRHEEALLDLSTRLVAMPLQLAPSVIQDGTPRQQPVTDAINHPIGHVTQALLNWWFTQKPNDNDGLPPSLEPLFTLLSDVSVDRYRYGRTLLASRLIALFRVDREWTTKHLLPRFDWTTSHSEAQSVWQGFLWSPRLYQPLLVALKQEILQTASRYDDLGDFARQFATLLTYGALGPLDGFASTDFQVAFASLPHEGLYESARALTQALAGAGDQKREYWRHRVLPFWREVWPQSRMLMTPEISEALAELCVVADEDLPEALSTVYAWIRPVLHPDYVVNLLHEAKACTRFPTEALMLLDGLIDESSYPPSDLESCLEQIRIALPRIEEDGRFRRLREFQRSRGF